MEAMVMETKADLEGVGEVIYTGSRVYGRPKDTSDIDCFMHGNPNRVQELKAAGWKPAHAGYPCDDVVSLRKGDHNLMVCLTDRAFAAWSLALSACSVIAPASRADAVAIHKQCFRLLNV